MKKLLTNKYFILLALILTIYGIKTFLSTRNLSDLSINNTHFKIEKAETIAQKTVGLMYRQSLKENRGMLFIYPTETYTAFWMKNTYIPLDMIWIDKDKKIVDITHNAQPCATENCSTYTTDNKILYVLEVKGGVSKKFGFKKGDLVSF